MNNVCGNPSGSNPIYFANSRCGVGFGDAIELTLACWVDQSGALLNAAVLVNNNLQWNAYDGPLRIPRAAATSTTFAACWCTSSVMSSGSITPTSTGRMLPQS